MTREILFRGKRVDNGEWVEGYYSPVNIPITGNMGHFINVGGYRAVEIDPETVSQFTGLEDKLGTKIFEGDVIDDLGVEYIVVFDSDYAQFRGKFDGWNAEISHIASRCEVIGNIHDNPELLEVSE